MKTKKCSKCGEIKPLNEFYKRKASSDGYGYICKTCKIKEGHQCYVNNLSSKQLIKYKKKHSRNKKREELLKEGKSICSKCNKIKSLTEFHKNPSTLHGYEYKCKNCRSKYRKKLRTKLKQDPKWVEYNRGLSRKKYHNKKDDPRFKLNHSISSGIRHSLKGNKNGRHWENLVSYKLEDLKKYLEQRFNDKMTWNNHGSYWHIDHIIPISAFNFTKPEHIGFKKCWSLKNLRPLSAKENLRKSDKLIRDKQEHLMI